MKLLTKTTIYIATLSLFLFFIMGIIFFQVLKNISISELNRELQDLKVLVNRYLEERNGEVPEQIPGLDSLVVRRISGQRFQPPRYGDTLMFDWKTEQYRTYRYLEYTSEQPSGSHYVRIFKSTTPADKLVERVTLMMTGMVILFLAGIFILNRFVFANLWKDFFQMLERLKQFDTSKEPLVLSEPDVLEFKELKNVMEKMTRRLSGEFRELKEYTDHTTHELQTPLAVIRTKTELLMQSESIGPEEMELIQAIGSSADRLSRLNSTLALITRIENQQYTGRDELDVAGMVNHHLDMLQELIDLRHIEVVSETGGKRLNVVMDEGLADILVGNLLKNAVVHNMEGGRLHAEIRGRSVVISNSGDPLPFREEDLFRRFVRRSPKNGNFGLGLSLVKKICDSYGFAIDYSYEEGMHTFSIDFSS